MGENILNAEAIHQVVLEIFHSATEIVSREKYPMLGIVQPLLQKLLFYTLAESLSDKPLSKRIK